MGPCVAVVLSRTVAKQCSVAVGSVFSSMAGPSFGSDLNEMIFCRLLGPCPVATLPAEAVLAFEVATVTGGFESTLSTGNDMPRSLPLLATPTPQVNCVRYPEQSFPMPRHCEQYGRRRSHSVPRLRQVWQSSAAPDGGTRLRRFFDCASTTVEVSGCCAAFCMMMEEGLETFRSLSEARGYCIQLWAVCFDGMSDSKARVFHSALLYMHGTAGFG